MSHKLYLLRRKIKHLFYRSIAVFQKPPIIKKVVNTSGDIVGSGNKVIWSTLVTANRTEELQIADSNLRKLEPVLAWSSLTIDGTSNDLCLFIEKNYKGGFDNVLWLSQPTIVSRRGYYAGKLGHFNRISLNYLRGWLCNLEQGEQGSASIFCHTDGDWEITIRPQSIEPLCRFFHERPNLIAISRFLDRYLTEEPNMWPDHDLNEAIWYGTGLLSTNLIISPIDRIRPLILDAIKAFPHHRHHALERLLGKLASTKQMFVAYPTIEYFNKHFLIDLQEKREPYAKTGVS